MAEAPKETGDSGISPPAPTENRFVVDVERSALDVPHLITESNRVVDVYMPTTRYVGTVDSDGFLVYGDAAVKAGRLAPTMLLTIRARISAIEAYGILGQDGVDVEVILHRGEKREKSLGKLVGDFGLDWEDYLCVVNTVDLKFPDDPCPNQDSSLACGQAPQMRLSKVSFVFSGITPLTLEIDWMTLETRGGVGLASRPVLLLHGWGQSAADMGKGTLWADQLTSRDIPWYAADLTPKGWAYQNAAQVAAAVSDMQRRFGVQRVNIVGFGKGGIDARFYTHNNNGAETLIMLASPNGGCFLTDIATVPLYFSFAMSAGFQMTSTGMDLLNLQATRNPNVLYVAISAFYDSPWAQFVATFQGPNDEVVTVDSVNSLPYAVNEPPYDCRMNDAESQGICATQGLTNHSCLRYNQVIVGNEMTLFLEPPDGPLRPSRRARLAENRTMPVEESAGDDLQGIGSETAEVPPEGLTQGHEVLIDAVENALFYAFAESDVLSLDLISPSGIRIDSTTPSTDSTVAHAPLLDAELCWYTAYQIQNPEPGTWTLEVTGTAEQSEESQYAVATFAQLIPGVGVSLTADADRESYVTGNEVAITATVTSDGGPVIDATLTAQMCQPDGNVTTPISLPAAGTASDGEYGGVFGDMSLPGLYTIVVSATGTNPDFTRQRMLQVNVAPSATAFSGVISDYGIDSDGDGRYDQLAIEVECEVDVAAEYRVFGTLTDSAGTAIEQVRVEQQLQPGSQIVSLLFDGARLFDLGLDGPYVLDDLVIEDVTTQTALASGPAYTTGAYSHDEFERPLCLLTGNTSDHGANADPGDQLPYEELIVEVEVDTLVDADVQAVAQLYAEDGTFITTGRAFSSLAAGLNTIEFHFPAPQIYRAGKAGPYNLQLLSMWGTSTEETPVSLRAPDVVAVTQPYALEDFGESPVFTIGGTVTGLEGEGLELTDFASSLSVHPGNGPFTFSQARPNGSAYDVRVTAQPTNPIQVCSIVNATGTVGSSNVTDIAVECVTTVQEAGLDPSFGSGGKVTAAQSAPAAIALQSDGKIVLVGSLTLARYENDGSPDPSFGSDGGIVSVDFGGSSYSAAQSLAVQPDGKIVVAGYTTSDTQGTQYEFALARYTPEGTPDLDFPGGGRLMTDFVGGYDKAYSVLIQPDGKIVVAGVTSTAGAFGQTEFGVARYTADGDLDPGFGSGGKVMTPIAGLSGSAAAVALQTDGKIVVAGPIYGAGGENTEFGLVRYSADGTPDPDFGDGGIVSADFGLPYIYPTGLALQDDDKPVVVGWVGGSPDTFAVARFDATGNPDTGFGSGGLVTTPFGTVGAWAQAVAIQPDGRIVVAGYTGGVFSDEDFAVARYTVDGRPDPDFGSEGKLTVDFFADSDRAHCIAIQADGKILVAGSASRGTLLAVIRMLP
jgi:uncharacterized delta-60 repeat protein